MIIIYFDNAATTKFNEKIIPEITNMLTTCYGNPSALHTKGIEAENKVIEARKSIGKLLNLDERCIIFTSGGTESNNIAILGIAEAYLKRGKHIITSNNEHPSVLNCITALEQRGWEISRLATLSDGSVDIDSLKDLVREDTTLVTLMHVNNETGAITDIERACDIIKNQNPNTKFHSDGVQSFGKFKVNLTNVDSFSISAHKIHGMKGVGALYVKKGLRIKPLFCGGNQEGGLRSGTENTAGIVSLYLCAEELYKDIDGNFQHVKKIKERFLDITKVLDGVYVNGSIKNGSPYILSLNFDGLMAETIIHALAENNIYASAGAACSSRNKKSMSSVRFSFSKYNSIEDAEKCTNILCQIVPYLRLSKVSLRR